MSDDMVRNLKTPSAWFRVLFMAGFVIALYVTGLILLVLTLAQIVFSLLTGEDNPNLRRLGASLSSYVGQILAYLTYNSHTKPFPFLPFPVAPEVEPAAAEPQDAGSTASESDEMAPAQTTPSATQSSASGSLDEAQAVADDDGFQQPADASESPAAPDDAAAAASSGRSARRKKISTDPEASQTDD